MYKTQMMPEREALRLGDFARTAKKFIPFVQRDDVEPDPAAISENAMVAGAISQAGETSKFKILERSKVEQYFPEVCNKKILDQVKMAGILYDRNAYGPGYYKKDSHVIESPFFRSSVNVNMYDLDGSRHAAHYDSNPIANLLCLWEEGPPLEILEDFYPGGPTWVEVPLRPGEMITFDGRKTMHRVPRYSEGEYRCVVSYTLYYSDDCYRPAGLDALAYGESQEVS